MQGYLKPHPPKRHIFNYATPNAAKHILSQHNKHNIPHQITTHDNLKSLHNTKILLNSDLSCASHTNILCWSTIMWLHTYILPTQFYLQCPTFPTTPSHHCALEPRHQRLPNSVTTSLCPLPTCAGWEWQPTPTSIDSTIIHPAKKK